MRWLTATYAPVSFFSLRPASATTSGGQTLLVPTGFALKMALLSASIQLAGVEEGRRRFAAIRDLRIALRPPEEITILKSFAKVRRLAEFKDAKTRDEKTLDLMEKKAYPFQPTIAYREMVQFGSPLALPGEEALRVALATPHGEVPPWVGEALVHVNYLGKRGGFVQLVALPAMLDAQDVPDGFTEITRDSVTPSPSGGSAFSLRGTLQMLDDCGTTMTFEHADIYNSKRITLGKERVLRHVVLPYTLARSSHGYSLYVRADGERGGEP